MFTPLKRFFWDLKHPTGRFNYVSAVIRNLPGQWGMLVRARYIPKFFAKAGKDTVILEGVRFWGAHRIEVGNNCVIGVENLLQGSGGLILGNNVLLGPGVKIWTMNHQFEDTDRSILDQGYIREKVSIGDGCWLGANVFVMPGVVLPEGCIVSAGSVVGKKKYPPWSILMGYPARVMGSRKKAEPPPGDSRVEMGEGAP